MMEPLSPHVAKKLLFERLTAIPSRDRQGPGGLRYTQKLAALKQSVQAELERLFNTRRQGEEERFAGERTILDYGLASVETLMWRYDSLAVGLPYEMGEAIAAFEPRLHDVRIEVESSGSGWERTQVHVSGILHLEQYAEPVSFPLTLTR